MNDLAKQLGITDQTLQSLINSIAYHKQYNQRPEVKQRRKERNQLVTKAKQLLREQPELLQQLKGDD
jgi:DNA-binding MarR family transcriptional regulator